MRPNLSSFQVLAVVCAIGIASSATASAQAVAQSSNTYAPRDKTRFPDALMPTAESAATHTSPIDKEMAGLTHQPDVPKPIPAGLVQPTWDSLKAYYKTPEWFRDAKFGIYIHWGIYSLVAYHNEWYSMHMYNTFSNYHAQTFGP